MRWNIANRSAFTIQRHCARRTARIFDAACAIQHHSQMFVESKRLAQLVAAVEKKMKQLVRSVNRSKEDGVLV